MAFEYLPSSSCLVSSIRVSVEMGVDSSSSSTTGAVAVVKTPSKLEAGVAAASVATSASLKTVKGVLSDFSILAVSVLEIDR